MSDSSLKNDKKPKKVETNYYIQDCISKKILDIKAFPYHSIDINSKVECMEISSSGRLIAIGSDNSCIKVWNLYKNKEIFCQSHLKKIILIKFMSNNQELISYSSDQMMKVWNIKKKFLEYEKKLKGKLISLGIKSRDKILALVKENKSIKVFKVEKNDMKILFNLDLTNEIIYASISDKGNYLTFGYGKFINVYNIKEEKKICKIKNRRKVKFCLCSSDEKCIASVASINHIKIWDIENEPKLKFTLKNETDITTLCFSPDSNHLAAGSNTIIKIWNLQRNEKVFTGNHSSIVNLVCFSPYGNLVASSTDDNKVNIWKIDEKLEKFKINHEEAILSLFFTFDSNYLISSSKEYHVIKTNIKNEENEKINASKKLNLFCYSSQSNRYAYVDEDENIIVTNINKLENDIVMKNEYKKINLIRFSNDGEFISSVSLNIYVEIWDINKQEKIFMIKNHIKITYIMFSPNSKLLARITKNKSLEVWNIVNKSIILEKEVNTIRFASDNKLLGMGLRYNGVIAWIIDKKENLFEEKTKGEVTIIKFTPNSSFLVLGLENFSIYLLNIKTKIQELIGKHSKIITSLSFSSNCELLASGSEDKSVKIWSIIEKREKFTGNHLKKVRKIRFSPNGKLLASGSDDKFVKVWNISSEQEENDLFENDITQYACCSTNGRLIAIFYNNSIEIKDIINGSLINSLNIENIPKSIYLSQKNNYLAYGWNNYKVAIWNINNNEINTVNTGKLLFCFSIDEQYFANLSSDKFLYLYEMKDINNPDQIPENQTTPISINISDNSQYLCIGYNHNLAIIWNIVSRNVEHIIEKLNRVRSIIFSNNNNFLALGNSDGIIIVWNINEKGEEFSENHCNAVNSLCFSPDNKYLASASEDNSTIIWGLEEKCKIFIARHPSAVSTICFLNDSNYLASGCKDKFVRVWNIKEKRIEFEKNIFSEVSLVKLSTDFNFLISISIENKVSIVKISCELFKDFIEKDNENNIGMYKIVQGNYGFNLFSKNNIKVDSFIHLYDDDTNLKLEVSSKPIVFTLNNDLIFNKIYSDLISYQKINKKLVKIDTEVLNTNCQVLRPRSLSDYFLSCPMSYLSSVEAIRSRDYKNITSAECNILLTEYKYSLLHFSSFLGDSVLKNLPKKEKEKIWMKADIFGKSPLYYSLMKKHRECFELTLKFLIDIEEDNLRLFSCLHSTRNDFSLVIESSSSQIHLFLSKILLISENLTELKILKKCFSNKCYRLLSIIKLKPKMPGISDLPFAIKSLSIDSNKDYSKGNRNNPLNTKMISCAIKYSAFPIFFEPYSRENIEFLKVLYGCTNKNIYDDCLIQYIINSNCEKVSLEFTLSMNIYKR